FRPLYERLLRSPQFEVFLAGGLRSEVPEDEVAERAEVGGDSDETTVATATATTAVATATAATVTATKRVHDAPALYGPFGVPADHVLSIDEIADRDFDLLFGANTKLIAPRSAGLRVQLFHGISFRNKSVREEN